MTDQWQPVDPPFADPSNPDIGIETELWKGGPRPQAEVQYGDKLADLKATDFVPSIWASKTLDAMRQSSWYTDLLTDRVKEEVTGAWTRSNWSAAPAANFVMDFSPRNYVMSAAPIYRLPISLPIMQQFRSWLVGRLDSLAAWLQP